MSKASSLVAKVDKTLSKFAPINRSAYKRVTTRVGGDDLIGRAGTVSHTDTLLNPQPFYQMLGRKAISGRHARPQTNISASGVTVTADDYEFLVSPTAVSLTELEQQTLQLVLKDSAGNEEVFNILDWVPTEAYGAAIVISIYARSVQR